ncbi:YegP family protein [Methylobacterium soli]|uniref:DUF1508 domain-containing protein n=1 Tax=Methylobacterium soli TaxID=553447 RepID=A0A6L3SUS0_9HYPH|nr:DUF1508 domain-containing protein [Methylobacterium soli]KAB1076979.1 DUF1508 domain-containing protein [Methylobacterium soli]GJE43249.1 hypothetical protein AEGHOMDF_2428 [Methylobacterium soli]
MGTCKDTNGDTWEIYKNRDGWRWRRTASNSRIVGASTEPYEGKTHCIENARRNGMGCNPI